jgi:hypothetical protein
MSQWVREARGGIVDRIGSSIAHCWPQEPHRAFGSVRTRGEIRVFLVTV